MNADPGVDTIRDSSQLCRSHVSYLLRNSSFAWISVIWNPQMVVLQFSIDLNLQVALLITILNRSIWYSLRIFCITVNYTVVRQICDPRPLWKLTHLAEAIASSSTRFSQILDHDKLPSRAFWSDYSLTRVDLHSIDTLEKYGPLHFLPGYWVCFVTVSSHMIYQGDKLFRVII